ncbi:MAG: hypothetical protein DSM107014_14540 [Gomphosphaeria aponina SAG 52.96 = DSM 107014]|uniref:DUF2203 domain-containing protein n=1 Tax=Gomphosphaeria aponina SAG 52.96 = DSM 107014 TaxID=1521640 RepID=A0A941JQJ1_9CHRO|nr:hypothetical protein [Gomphosphaeria aponina SAG 52.96 = DSM 107014]
MPPPDLNQLPEIEQALLDLEQSFVALKERLAQVKRDEERREELTERVNELKEQKKNNRATEPIKTEIRLLQRELEEIEVNLESRLLSFSAFKEPFWQAVRFAGMGVVIGWVLKSCAG